MFFDLMEAEMATAAQLAANRANAQASTGPKTEAGKARSARNALKHGLCAERLLLDGEDPAAWAALRADYFARLQPCGEAEARLVDRIAQLAFRRERGSPAEAAAWRGYARGGWIVDKKERGKQRWHEDRDPVVAERATPVMNGVMAELLRITMYESRLGREAQRLTAELEKLQYRRRYSSYRAEPVEAPEAEAPRPRADCAAEPQESAEIGFVPSPEATPPAAPAPAAASGFAPPPAEASLAEWQAWTKRERARLDAEAQAFRAAHESQDTPAA